MKNSYTSADSGLPVKILHDTVMLCSILNTNTIPLRHLQLCPTNRCQLGCKFCSCGDRERGVEMSLEQASSVIRDAKECGCKAITITGGGEPLLYPHINEIIKYCNESGIKVGLVTNGLALGSLEIPPAWCRVSFDSNRKFRVLSSPLTAAVKKFPTVDWAFSFVAYELKLGELKRMVNYANANRFTHVRVVADILHPSDEIVNRAQRYLHGIDQKVIYQPRTKPTRGRSRCLISLLKPTVAADGNIYPCCGAQYAIKDSKHDFHKKMTMGKDLLEVNKKQMYFKGDVCDVCYYENYNSILNMLMEPVKHKDWI